MHLLSNPIIQQLVHNKYAILILLFSLGTLMPLAFSPYDAVWLPIPLLTLFILLIYESTVRQSVLQAWFFGFGMFTTGVFWVFESFHLFTDVPSIIAILIAILFAAYQAVFVALAVFIAKCWWHNKSIQFLIALPATWYVAESLRGKVFVGFPWLYLGHSQADSILAGYMPIIGSAGVSFILMVCAGLVTYVFLKRAYYLHVVAIFCVIWFVGWGLGFIQWSHAVGQPINVSVLQGNISQGDKWNPDTVQKAMRWYEEQTLLHLSSDIVIWPETAIANYLREARGFLSVLRDKLADTGTEVLVGVFIVKPGSEIFGYFNSLISLRGQRYDKRVLVPIGEYYPWSFAPVWLQQKLSFPMSRVVSSETNRSTILVGDYTIATTICYELAYTRVIFDDANFHFMVNISNDGHFENTIEPYQHHQLARIRAIESSRYMLRSSNTGISAIIDHHGYVIALTPLSKEAVITAFVQPRSGLTPYVRFGDAPMTIFLLLAVIACTVYIWIGRRKLLLK